MAVPARPVAGALLDAAWGQVAHDSAVAVVGIVVDSAVVAATTSVTFTPRLVDGLGSMIVGTDLVVPSDGLWEVMADMNGASGTGYYRCHIQADAVTPGTFIEVCAGSGVPSGSTGQHAGASSIVFLAAGRRVRFVGTAGSASSLNLARAVVAYRGADFSA